jgi:cell wall-associated NlpC family hydrolase
LAAIGFVVPALGAGRAEAATLRSDSAVVAASAERTLDSLQVWQDTAEPAAYVRYVRGRDRVAADVASELELSPDQMRAAFADADIDNQQALLTALTQLGVPYRTNASEEGVGFDCSGLTTYAWASAGIDLPRQSGSQIKDAESVDADEAQAGDLVYYPGHIMMYLGVGDAIIHSRNSGSTVEITFVTSGHSVRFGEPG